MIWDAIVPNYEVIVMSLTLQLLGWGLLYPASPFCCYFFKVFSNFQNTRCLFNISFIFDRCCRSWAAETPVKYESETKHLTNMFTKSETFSFGWINEGGSACLVTPTRGTVCTWDQAYRKTSTISRTLVGNEIVDNSDVVGASPVGAAPTTSSFST